MSNIYNNGTYIDQNPGLHEEDSAYKFNQIKEYLNFIKLPDTKIRILDVGGGAGRLGNLVYEYLKKKGYRIDFTALDLSEEMLNIQKKNNPNIKRTVNCSVEEYIGETFDLVLMIDVIEHIPNYTDTLKKLESLSEFIIYNIPIEKNAIDLLRNILMGGKYYRLQTDSIGHIHFFSIFSIKRILNKFSTVIKGKFTAYCDLVFSVDHPNYNNQYKGFSLRSGELYVSRFIYKFLKIISPLLIQGSFYCLVKTK